eukprot:4406647-Lingulodinium_polyedra.AAC.1
MAALRGEGPHLPCQPQDAWPTSTGHAPRHTDSTILQNEPALRIFVDVEYKGRCKIPDWIGLSCLNHGA